MRFSEKLIRLRKIKGITQDEFAKEVGVSRQAVYKWESGQSYPEVAKLLEIKALFGISIDDLLDESFEIALPEKKKRKRAERVERVPERDAAIIEAPIEKKEDIIIPDKQEVPEIKEIEKIESIPESEVAVEESEKSVAVPVVEKEVKEEKEDKEEPRRMGFFTRIFGRK